MTSGARESGAVCDIDEGSLAQDSPEAAAKVWRLEPRPG